MFLVTPARKSIRFYRGKIRQKEIGDKDCGQKFREEREKRKEKKGKERKRGKAGKAGKTRVRWVQVDAAQQHRTEQS